MRSAETNSTTSVFREVHLRDYWRIVWEGRWTLLAIFSLCVVGTAAWSFTQTPIYMATATLEVQPKARQLAAGRDVSGLGAAGYGWFAEEKYHNTQVEIIKSRDVATRVIDDLNLSSHEMLKEASDPVDVFRGMIQAVPRRETGLIEISMMGAAPDDITRWVNAVSDAYVARNLHKAQANVEVAIDTIRTQMKSLEEEFSLAETERFDVLKGSRVFNSEEQVEIVREKLKTYNAQFTEVQLELSRLREQLNRIRKTGESGLLSVPMLAEDSTLQELSSTKVNLERQLEIAKVELRPDHPTYEKTVNELAKVQQRIRDQVRVILGTLQMRYDLAVEHEKYLSTQIESAEDFSLQVAEATSDYGVYKSRAETKKRIFDLIARTMTEVQFGAELLNNNVSVLDAATVPRYPVKPRKRVNLMIGAVFGMFLGVAATFFLDYLDNTFRTPEDVEKYLKASVLGVIPKAPGEDWQTDRGAREAYQSLRTSVIFSSKNRERKLILITSTGPQEGKSSTVTNLARTLATAGDRVVVVDCDLRRPTQHLRVDLDRETGLTNYLSAPLDVTDYKPFVKSTAVPNLDVFTCGPIPPSPPELLGSDRFRELLETLRHDYDWVLIDSPPAASLTDTTQLAGLADMLIMVVQHNRTDRDVVAKTLERLRAVNPTVAGVVLNNVDLDRAYDKNNYYAAYYYYGEGSDKQGKKSKKGTKKRRSEPSANVG